MQTMRWSDSAQPPVLVEETVPQPQPRRGELLVRVYAAGVTPTELLWYPTTHSKTGERRSHAVPGHEFSGVVAAVGEGSGLALAPYRIRVNAVAPGPTETGMLARSGLPTAIVAPIKEDKEISRYPLLQTETPGFPLA